MFMYLILVFIPPNNWSIVSVDDENIKFVWSDEETYLNTIFVSFSVELPLVTVITAKAFCVVSFVNLLLSGE